MVHLFLSGRIPKALVIQIFLSDIAGIYFRVFFLFSIAFCLVIYQFISTPLQVMRMKMMNDYTFLFISFGAASLSYLQEIIIFL